VSARFVRGDLAALPLEEIGGGFDLFLDFGAALGMTRAQQGCVSGGVTALALERATLIMLAFEPARRGPLPRGMSRDEVEAA